MKNSRFPIVMFLGFGFLLAQLSFSLYMPALPELEILFRVNHQAILSTVTSLLIGYGVGQLLWGPLSDRHGRRPILIIALLFYGLFISLVALSDDLFWFSLALGLAGFFMAAIPSVGNAILRDLDEKINFRRSIAVIGVFMGSGPVIAPFVGSYLLYWFSWESVFIFLLAFAALFFVGVLSIKEIKHQAHRSQARTNQIILVYKKKLSNKRFIVFISSLGLIFGCLISFISNAPFIYIRFFHMSLTMFGRVFFLAGFSYLLSTIFYSKYALYKSPIYFVTLGNTLALIGCLGMSAIAEIGSDKLSLFVLMTVISMAGLGLVVPAAKAGAMSLFKEHNGTTASLMKTVQVFFALIINFVGSHLYSSSSFLHLTVFYSTLIAISLMIQKGLWKYA